MVQKQFLQSSGTGLAQLMPIIDGNFGSTTGPDNIDVSDMNGIMFDTEVIIYTESHNTATFTLIACQPIGVQTLSSLHVSAATNYVYA